MLSNNKPLSGKLLLVYARALRAIRTEMKLRTTELGYGKDTVITPTISNQLNIMLSDVIKTNTNIPTFVTDCDDDKDSIALVMAHLYNDCFPRLRDFDAWYNDIYNSINTLN